jgi:leucyl-tRNA synthetase
MKLYPEKVRQQFDYVIDWLHKWACTREEGLGTRLPWDEKWVIESLSDSTVYMAYYTLLPLLKDEDSEDLNDELFNYIFRNEKFSDKIRISKEKADKLKEEFEYWYPVDFRNSGKDLIQNHLTFFIFNHVAIFDEKYWPQSIGANGWVTVDGVKMSKSLGNMIPVRDMVEEFSADASRITILNGGETLDDPNWDSSFAKNIIPKITNLFDTFLQVYNKGVGDFRSIDGWANSEINRIIKEASEFMELTHFRSAIQKIFFETQNLVKWYLVRTNNKPNKEVMNKIVDSMIVMMHPFTAHITEEYNEKLGNKKSVLDSSWPSFDEKKIDKNLDLSEKIIENTTKDVHNVKKLANVENIKKITIIVSKDWKYDYFNKLIGLVEKTRNVSDILKELMSDDKLRLFGKDISKLTPRLVATNKVPNNVLDKEMEVELFIQSKEYFENTFNCEIEILIGDKTDNPKANNAMPGKPAIIIE